MRTSSILLLCDRNQISAKGWIEEKREVRISNDEGKSKGINYEKARKDSRLDIGCWMLDAGLLVAVWRPYW